MTNQIRRQKHENITVFVKVGVQYEVLNQKKMKTL